MKIYNSLLTTIFLSMIFTFVASNYLLATHLETSNQNTLLIADSKSEEEEEEEEEDDDDC